MMCLQFREEMMEWARGGAASDPVREHAAVCEACAAFLDGQRELTAKMGAIAADPIPAADVLAGRILAEFDNSRRKRKTAILAWPAATAVLTAAASLLLTVSPTTPAPPPDAGQFLPIPYTVPLSPEERASVVRMDIPVTALIAAGFRIPATDPATIVQADVLVSQDGRARAIRPISISNTD